MLIGFAVEKKVMPDDETTEQQAETPPIIEAETEAVSTAENAVEIAEQAQNTAETAIEIEVDITRVLAEHDGRISAIEGRLSNDERTSGNDTEPELFGDDTGSGRSGSDAESTSETSDERRDSRPSIRHWWYGKR